MTNFVGRNNRYKKKQKSNPEIQAALYGGVVTAFIPGLNSCHKIAISTTSYLFGTEEPVLFLHPGLYRCTLTCLQPSECESENLQYVGNVRHNSTALNSFVRAAKVTNHTGLWDDELAWYSPSVTLRIFRGREGDQPH